MQKHGHQSDPKARANVVIIEAVCPVYFCSCVRIGVALFDICSCEDQGNSADGTGVHDGFLWSEPMPLLCILHKLGLSSDSGSSISSLDWLELPHFFATFP